jgi:hypothetical protein
LPRANFATLDRIFTRPSVEHTIETEKPTLKREDEDDGE